MIDLYESLKAPLPYQREKFNCEVTLQYFRHNFVIVYHRDWPALKNQNILEFLMKKIIKCLGYFNWDPKCLLSISQTFLHGKNTSYRR